MITREFKLYLNAGVGVAPVINANQFDQDEEWIFTLLQSDGTVYTPSTGAIIGLKQDGTTILNAGTVNSAGQVVITETEQITAVPGSNLFEILIDGNTHGTANFVVFVERRPGDIDNPSETDISLFQEAISAAGNVTQFQADISALQSGLSQETQTRQAQDTSLASQIAQEASTRSQQDAVLQAEIDQIIAPSGEAPSAAEVQNARIGVDGTTYDTLGNAIRTQVSDLKNALDLKLINSESDMQLCNFTSSTGNIKLVSGDKCLASTNRTKILLPEVVEVNCEEGYEYGIAYCNFYGNGNVALNVNYNVVNTGTYWHSESSIITIPETAEAIFVTIRKSNGEAIPASDYNKVTFVMHNKWLYEEMSNRIETISTVTTNLEEFVNDNKEYNAISVLKSFNTTTYVSSGITFTYNGDGVYHVEGTATRDIGKTFTGSTNSIPDGFETGMQIFVKHISDNVGINIIEYLNDAEVKNTTIYNDTLYVIGNNITGLQLRIYVENGTTVNEDAKPTVLNVYSNEKLTELAKIESEKTYNVLNVESLTNKVTNGIRYAFEGLGGKCKVSGTATAISYHTILGDSSSVPDGLEAGKLVKVEYESTNVALHFIQKDEEGQTIYNEFFYNDGIVPISENATSVEIRLRVANGVTVDETVNPVILNHLEDNDLSKVCYDLVKNDSKPFYTLEQAAKSFYVMTRTLGYTYGKRSALYYPDADPEYDPEVDTELNQIHCGGMTALLVSGCNFYNSRYFDKNVPNKSFVSGYGFDFESYSLLRAKGGNQAEIDYIGEENVSKTVDQLKELMLFKTSYQLSCACLRWDKIVYIYNNGIVNKDALRTGDLLFFGKPNSGQPQMIDGHWVENPILFDGNLISHCNIIIKIDGNKITVAEAGSAPMQIIDFDNVWNNAQLFKYVCAGRVPLYDLYR